MEKKDQPEEEEGREEEERTGGGECRRYVINIERTIQFLFYKISVTELSIQPQFSIYLFYVTGEQPNAVLTHLLFLAADQSFLKSASSFPLSLACHRINK